MRRPPYFVGLDVGGTTMKAAVVDDAGRSLPIVTLPTQAWRGQDHGLAQMCRTIRKAVAAANLKMKEIAAIGVATPGTMDIPAGVMLEPHNLAPWRNVPVRQAIHETFGLPTAFQNDANAAAFGEYWVGAGRTARSLVMFTLGTGIGGGIIVNDRVLEGQHSHGAEVGHIRIDLGQNRQCGCGRWGCLEAFASGTAVVKRAQEVAHGQPPGSILRQRLEQSTEDLPAKAVFQAWLDGDPDAATIVKETAFYLAVGAVNLMHVIDPDIVVFGGGMIEVGDRFLNMIRRHVRRLALPVPGQRTVVRYAQLRGNAGIIGAAACARQLVRHPA